MAHPTAELGGMKIQAEVSAPFAKILTPEACRFVARLAARFEPERQKLLGARTERQKQIKGGALPDFLEETREVRNAEWSVAPIPNDLADRRVEITGPPDRKMMINALNSGASVYMADFEDSNSPTWRNLIEGQINLRDAIRRDDRHITSPEGKQLHAERARPPRSWSVRAAGIWRRSTCCWRASRSPASLFDFGLFFFHNARNCCNAAAARISICPRWKAIGKRGCGTTCFFSRRTNSAFPAAPSGPPC